MGFSWRVDRKVEFGLFRVFGWRGLRWIWRSEAIDCSWNRCGSVVSMVGCGKLYVGVVTVYCSITMIHQYSIVLLVKYLKNVHAHLAQYNMQ